MYKPRKGVIYTFNQDLSNETLAKNIQTVFGNVEVKRKNEQAVKFSFKDKNGVEWKIIIEIEKLQESHMTPVMIYDEYYSAHKDEKPVNAHLYISIQSPFKNEKEWRDYKGPFYETDIMHKMLFIYDNSISPTTGAFQSGGKLQ